MRDKARLCHATYLTALSLHHGDLGHCQINIHTHIKCTINSSSINHMSFFYLSHIYLSIIYLPVVFLPSIYLLSTYLLIFYVSIIYLCIWYVHRYNVYIYIIYISPIYLCINHLCICHQPINLSRICNTSIMYLWPTHQLSIIICLSLIYLSMVYLLAHAYTWMRIGTQFVSWPNTWPKPMPGCLSFPLCLFILPLLHSVAHIFRQAE